MKVKIKDKEVSKIADDILWQYFSIDIHDVRKWANENEGRIKSQPFIQQYLNEKYPQNIKHPTP